jgi:hypothetical protein
MVSRALLALVMVSGCDRVWGLHRDDVLDATADAALHDEDHDGVADDLDPCPADPGGGNADGDQAGNLCDPSDLSSEQRVMFDPFTELVAWTGSVPWTRAIAPFTYPTLEVTFSGVTTESSYTGAGFTVGGVEIGCYLHVGIGTTGTLEVWYNEILEVVTAWTAADAPVHLTLTQLVDKTFRCRARRDNETPIELPYALVQDATTTALGLKAAGTKITATSVAVWRTI